MSPFFSLILPCFNVAQYMARCVQSILEQSFTDYEIILVDDGSTDSTPALCDVLASNDARIRVIHKSNGGLSSARNAGLDAAKGQYVWFIDADDWIEKQALARIHQVIQAADVDVVKFDYYRVDSSKEPVLCDVKQGLYQAEMLDQLRRQAFCGAGRYCLSACMHVYRRDLLDKHGLRFVSERDVGSEDYLFNLQVLLHVSRLWKIASPLYSYERRAGSLTQTYKADLVLRYISLREKLFSYYSSHEMLGQYGAFIERFFLWHLIIGTCVTQEYDTVSLGRQMRDARRGVRGLLQYQETQQAVLRSDKSGMSWKKKVLLQAVRLRCEAIFYWVYGAKLVRRS